MSGDVLMADGSVRQMTDDERAAYEPALRRSLSETKEFGAEAERVLTPYADAAAEKWRVERARVSIMLHSLTKWPCTWNHPWLAERARPCMVRTPWATYLSEGVG